jgi:hypothetical protein
MHKAVMMEYRPIFLSADREAALEYYGKLGFVYNTFTGFLERDHVKFTLHQVEDSQRQSIATNKSIDGWSWDMYVWVDDADALYREFLHCGAMIEYPPRDPVEYEMREFAIRDLDGYILAFGSRAT